MYVHGKHSKSSCMQNIWEYDGGMGLATRTASATRSNKRIGMAKGASLRSSKGCNNSRRRDNNTINKHNNKIMKACRAATDTLRVPYKIAIGAARKAQRHDRGQGRHSG